MNDSLEDRIRRSRLLLKNQYAYLDGEGKYDAISCQVNLPDEKAPQDVHDARWRLGNPYAYLDGEGGYAEYPTGEIPSSPADIYIDLHLVRNGERRGRKFTKREIESFVRNLQKELWERRKANWSGNKLLDPISVLDPRLALKAIGYAVEDHEKLGQVSNEGEIFEIAGTIDNDQCLVQISQRFGPEIQNFTMAHELAHAVLHDTGGLHRDRAIDGGTGNRQREEPETEADFFAVYFLMPEKLVRSEFEVRFLARKFVLNDDTAFSLTLKGLEAVEKSYRTQRDLARLLATSEIYGGRHFDSLASRFKVSAEAMAIRIEELGLIDR